MDMIKRNSSPLAKRRMSFNMTQNSLASKLGVGRTHVAAWEVGDFRPSLEGAVKLAGTLECCIGDIAHDVGIRVPKRMRSK